MSSFLDNHRRQPKLFIDLPSSGQFYSENVIENEQTVHLPVYALTAADEIMAKTPDALFSGQATASIIKSCIPQILDPWQLVKTDVDYILTAIRLASYGDTVNLDSTCPSCGNVNQVEFPLQNILNFYDNAPQVAEFDYENLTIKMKPITYRVLTSIGLATYNLQRQVYNIQSSDASVEDKNNQLTEVLAQLSQQSARAVVHYIDSISDNNDTENNNEKIHEFVSQNDVAVSRHFVDHVEKFITELTFPAQKIQCANEECGHVYEVNYENDYAAFFARK